jgi:hypothetical protein
VSSKRAEMVWILGDGTEVRLGGDVRGDSAFARRLRQDVDDVREGLKRTVTRHPIPSGEDLLDLDNPLIVDTWIRNQLWSNSVQLTSAPKLRRPKAKPGGGPPGRVY